MAEIVVVEMLTLDGVMQAPGRPDEDRRDGFEHGGWANGYRDEVMGEVMGKGMAAPGAMLFGRRTYEDFASVWPNQPEDNPFTKVLNARQKYVVSTTLKEPLPWENSTVLAGDPVEAVAALKAGEGPDLTVLGSGVLAQALIAAGLVDRYMLSLHPLVLGSGRRLFGRDGTFASLRLVDARPTTTGVIIGTYEPGDPAAPPAS